MTEETLKSYSPREEKCNVLTHAAGAVIAAAALAVLPFLGFRSLAAGIGFAVYGLTLLFVYVGSSCYHAATERSRRQLLRKFDHAAIYLLIAGTYTPLMLAGLPEWRGYAVLAGCWLLAVIGLLLNFFRFGKDPKTALTLYLVMGWLCIIVIVPLYRSMGRTAFAFLLGGGVAYTAGVAFYAMKREFSHAVWHFFTLAGSTLHFLAIALITLRR